MTGVGSSKFTTFVLQNVSYKEASLKIIEEIKLFTFD